MARPTKQGVDYFPLDVHMDDKFKFIEIKYKLEGFAVVIKLMQRIYSNGYWCKWTEDEQLLFCDENRVDLPVLHEVFLECLKRGIFHEGMYLNHSILTSKGIQKRYKEMIRRRKDVEWMTEYLLIDDINASSTVVIDDIKPSLSRHDDGKSTQSKVNKTKQNKTKENENKILTAFESFWNYYPRKLDKKKAFEKFKVSVKNHEPEIIIQGAADYASECKIKETEKQFIKHPTTFLNSESFLNDFDFTKNPGQARKKPLFEQGEESKARQAAGEKEMEDKVIDWDKELEDLPF